MKIAIRVDASIEMGSGHVMRCLTLAEALREKGAEAYFISRTHNGNLIEFTKSKGFKVFTLPKGNYEEKNGDLAHASWLGESWERDAEQTREVISEVGCDWLIVDHYALDKNWESELRKYCKNLMVIDDLADRDHDCDVLLDQTFGRDKSDYQNRTPSSCALLLGSQYALLRPEFAKWREFSLSRREKPELKKLLIFLGGVDSDNITGQVLAELSKTNSLGDLETTVVMGKTAKWLNEICDQVRNISGEIRVLSGVDNMAELMANSDLAIGAAGTTSWERCCLGVPSLVFCLADNQKLILGNLDKYGALVKVENSREIIDKLKIFNTQKLKEISLKSSSITYGQGVNRVMEYLL